MGSINDRQNPLTTNLDGFTNASVSDGSVSIVSAAAQFNSGTSAGKKGVLSTYSTPDSLPDGGHAHYRYKSFPGSGSYQHNYYFGDFDANSYLQLSRVDGTDWILNRYSAGTPTLIFDNLDFDVNAQRWVRFVRSGTNILLQFAPDDGSSPGTWVPQATIAIADLSGFDEDNLHVEVDFRYNGTSSQILEIEAFNTDVGGGGGGAALVEVVTEPVGVTESVASFLGLTRSVAESIGVSEAASRVRGLVRGVLDSLGVAHSSVAVVEEGEPEPVLAAPRRGIYFMGRNLTWLGRE